MYIWKVDHKQIDKSHIWCACMANYRTRQSLSQKLFERVNYIWFNKLLFPNHCTRAGNIFFLFLDQHTTQIKMMFFWIYIKIPQEEDNWFGRRMDHKKTIDDKNENKYLIMVLGCLLWCVFSQTLEPLQKLCAINSVLMIFVKTEIFV